MFVDLSLNKNAPYEFTNQIVGKGFLKRKVVGLRAHHIVLIIIVLKNAKNDLKSLIDHFAVLCLPGF